jgi:phosphoribosylanthranilate isomerase
MEKKEYSVEIKICGLTKPVEAAYLNDADVDYAGFVFYDKSRRKVSIEQADSIRRELKPSIKAVAVTVSPDVLLAQELERAGFDILQVHRELALEVLEAVKIPVWYAFNVSDAAEVEEKQQYFEQLPKPLADKIEAIVVDGANFGSGRTFDWTGEWINEKGQKLSAIFQNRKFILAGGLKPQNVSEGIGIFHPDMVDVSSAVEGQYGKDKEKIEAFVRSARSARLQATAKI